MSKVEKVAIDSSVLLIKYSFGYDIDPSVRILLNELCQQTNVTLQRRQRIIDGRGS